MTQQTAMSVMESGKNCFLTGEAGTGKTYLLNAFVKKKLETTPERKIIICAPTGTAAVNANGETMHRLFSIPTGGISARTADTDMEGIKKSKPENGKKPYEMNDSDVWLLARHLDEDTRSRIEDCEVIIIDEVSMARNDAFRYMVSTVRAVRMEKTLRKLAASGTNLETMDLSRIKPEMPQFILCGDFYQLPPVVSDKDYERRDVMRTVTYTDENTGETVTKEEPDTYETQDIYGFPETRTKTKKVNLLKENGYDPSGYCFMEDAWDDLDLQPLVLTEKHRQKDTDFCRALDIIRAGGYDAMRGSVSEKDLDWAIDLINTNCYDPSATVDETKTTYMNFVNKNIYSEEKKKRGNKTDYLGWNPRVIEKIAKETRQIVTKQECKIALVDTRTGDTVSSEQGIRSIMSSLYDKIGSENSSYEEKTKRLIDNILPDHKCDGFQKEISLFDGERIMFTKNDKEGRFQNGTIGTVVRALEYIKDEEGKWHNIHSIRVAVEDPIKKDEDGKPIINEFELGEETFELESTYTDENDRTYRICVHQYPVVPGYGITIHKSQGQTYSNVCIEMPKSGSNARWGPALAYVALSRATDMEHLKLKNPLTKWHIRTDQTVNDFYRIINDKSRKLEMSLREKQNAAENSGPSADRGKKHVANNTARHGMQNETEFSVQ